LEQGEEDMGAITHSDELDISNFKLGIWEHYKGGRYTALMIVQHHDTRKPMVVYCSHERGSINCRPLRGWHGAVSGVLPHDPDGWLDDIPVTIPGGPSTVPRFRYIGPAQS
jgi:hypothetical protein